MGLTVAVKVTGRPVFTHIFHAVEGDVEVVGMPFKVVSLFAMVLCALLMLIVISIDNNKTLLNQKSKIPLRGNINSKKRRDCHECWQWGVYSGVGDRQR